MRTSRRPSRRRRRSGVVDAYIDDLRAELVDEFFLPVLQMHARYENRYLLGTSIARIPTARGQMRYAKRIGGNVLVHGSTGKGNDQVRFETIYRVLQEDPEYSLNDFGIYAPWKEPDFLARFGDGGRRVMTAYSQEHHIPLPSGGTDEGPPYSQDANVLHISSEGRALEKPEDDHREVLFSYLKRWDQTPDTPVRVRIAFLKGKPVGVELLDDDRNPLGQGIEIGAHDSILPVVEYLNEIGGQHGVGLLDMVESRYVGLKSRGVYEAPAHAILLAAHEDLESLVHDHRVLHDKAKRALDAAESVYQGKWFVQEMQSLAGRQRGGAAARHGLERGAPAQGRHPACRALQRALPVQRIDGLLRRRFGPVRPGEGPRLHRHPGHGAAGPDASAPVTA